MSVPLCQAKAEFFPMPGYPARIRLLKLLHDGPMPVRDPLGTPEVEPSALSPKPAVPRRPGNVVSAGGGSSVVCVLAGGGIAR